MTDLKGLGFTKALGLNVNNDNLMQIVEIIVFN